VQRVDLLCECTSERNEHRSLAVHVDAVAKLPHVTIQPGTVLDFASVEPAALGSSALPHQQSPHHRQVTLKNDSEVQATVTVHRVPRVQGSVAVTEPHVFHVEPMQLTLAPKSSSELKVAFHPHTTGVFSTESFQLITPASKLLGAAPVRP